METTTIKDIPLTMNECYPGMLVKFIDPSHKLYNQIKEQYGIIEKLDIIHSNPHVSTCWINFFESSDYDGKKHKQCFYPKRLAIENRIDPTKPQLSKIERKIRKLWNQSEYATKNNLAY